MAYGWGDAGRRWGSGLGWLEVSWRLEEGGLLQRHQDLTDYQLHLSHKRGEVLKRSSNLTCYVAMLCYYCYGANSCDVASC